VRAKERETGLNYLSWIQEELFQAQENESKDAVPVVLPQKINIMTIHASKGLEFDYVLLPFLASEVKKSHNKEFAFAKDFWGFPILDEVGSKSFSPQAYEFFENEFLMRGVNAPESRIENLFYEPKTWQISRSKHILDA
jgi:ATP-dependent exoDNAse (exonuclease V) beta subunit